MNFANWLKQLLKINSPRKPIRSARPAVEHLEDRIQPSTMIRSIDGKCLGTTTASFVSDKAQGGIAVFAEQLLDLLAEYAGIERQSAPAVYQVPGGKWFDSYLLRLEQLLAVRCGGIEGVRPGFLHGERGLLDGNLQLCLEFPQNVVVRILLAQTLVAMKRGRPEVPAEFKEKITLLQKEKPLTEPAHSVVQRIFNEVLVA